MDQNVEKYKVAIRSKKCWPIFMFCIDLALLQTWHLYLFTKAGKESPLDHLAVCRYIVEGLLAPENRELLLVQQRGCPVAHAKHVPEGIRYDHKDHYAISSK